MTPETALTEILARPEEHLGNATAHACYEHLLALQEADAPDAEKVEAIAAFAEAKRRLRGDLVDLVAL